MMRAKMQVVAVSAYKDDKGVTASERLVLSAVGPSKLYNADGTGDEDNTFSRWTPCANVDMQIQNPELFGKFSVGDRLYVDFTKVE